MSTEESIKRDAEALQNLIDLKRDYAEILTDESKKVLEYLRLKKQLAAAEKMGAENIEQLREAALKYRDSMAETAVEILQMTEQIEEQSESLKNQRESLAKSEKRVASFKKGIDDLTQSNISSVMSLKGFAENVLKVTFALEGQGIELARSTGYTKDFADNLTDLMKRNRGLALSITENQQLIAGLSLGMSRFNAVGDIQQRVLEDIGARFLRLGVDTKEFGLALDSINYAFGLTGQAAADAAHNLDTLSSEIGRPLGSVVKDFNELAPTLARFGRQGPEVFRKLNIQARQLGLTVRQAFDVSELFDTFEGAADVAGRLNAQLGLQLNSVELMRASSEDRIPLLKREFELQGKNFSSMDRRQKQMIAGILKVDEKTAASLLGDSMDISQFQKEKAEEKTMTDMVKLQEHMNRLMQEMAQDFAGPLIEVFKFIKRHMETIIEWTPKLVLALGALKGAGMVNALTGGAAARGAGGLLSKIGAMVGIGGTAAAGAGSKTAVQAAAMALKASTTGMTSQAALAAAKAAGVGAAKGVSRLIPGLGGAITAGVNKASGQSWGRSITTGIASAIGGIGGAALGIGWGSIPLAIGGSVAGEKLGGAAYDWITGEPTAPASGAGSVKAMNRSTSQSHQSSRSSSGQNIVVKELTLPIRLIVDGREFTPIIEKALNITLSPMTPV